MTADNLLVLAILLGAMILFASEWLAVDLVAVLIVLVVVGTGLIPIQDALAGFGNPAVIGVAALFVVSEGLLRTGALGVVANQLERWSKGSPHRLTVLVLVIVATSSAFLNNTPVVAMFIPIVLGVSHKVGLNPSHLLIPLSYAAILGGTCTLIGTSTNILVASIVEQHGATPPTMFEFAKLGVLLTVVGVTYLVLFGRKLLPERETISSMTSGEQRLREYVTELAIKKGGKLVGKRFADTVLATPVGFRVIQLIRGEKVIWPPLRDQVLRPGDALVTTGRIPDLMKLQQQEGLESLAEILADDDMELSSHETELAELLVLANSPYVGRNLESAGLRSNFGINVLAIQRHGMHLRKKLSEHPLRVGDLLLVQGTPGALQRIGSQEGLVLMSGVGDVMVRRDKAPLAITILVVLILTLSLSGLHMAWVTLAGAMAMVLSGCLPAGKIYEAIHWRVIILVAGTLALGAAMEATGTADLIASNLVNLFHFGGPQVLIFVLLVLAALMTECISNNAVAVILTPVALNMPNQFTTGDPLDPMPFIMAIAYGASCSFLTPIGYNTNAMVYGAGGYRFTDFCRLGLPLVLIIWLIGGFLIPVIWPF